MNKKVGILILHGIGIRNKGYASSMIEGIKSELAVSGVMADDVEFNEVLYSGLFGYNQKERSSYLTNTSFVWQLITKVLRKILIFILSDAVSYRASYKEIHQRISEHIEELQGRLDEDAPVIILAHSMGAMAISDYIYDEQEHKYPALNLAKINNLKALVSFGCNIPLFEMGHEKTVCIKRPESDWQDKEFFWLNYYSPFDVLGYRISRYYNDRPIPSFDIQDIRLFAGGLATCWNIFSHIGYWKHRAIHKLVAKTIGKYINQGSIK